MIEEHEAVRIAALGIAMGQTKPSMARDLAPLFERSARDALGALKSEGWRIVKLNSQGYPEQGLYCVVDEL